MYRGNVQLSSSSIVLCGVIKFFSKLPFCNYGVFLLGTPCSKITKWRQSDSMVSDIMDPMANIMISKTVTMAYW